MDISAHVFSLTDRPQRAIRVTSVRMRREDRTSISSHPLADLGWKLLIGLRHRLLLISRREIVLAEWQKTLFLRNESPETRGWLLDVMKCVESLGKRDFTLDEVYAFERHLGDLHPGNQNVKPKIRQQLQYLRDRVFIDFVSRGNYRLRP